jgi:hypothetical protein
MTRRRTALALSILAATGGCRDAGADAAFAGSIDTLAGGVVHVRNPAQGMWRPGEAWTLEEELRIGAADGGGPQMLGAVAALEVDAAGRIYVLERQAMEIRVFDAAGRHVRTVGRKGAGPGELEQPVGLQWDPRGRLWTLDQGNARFSVFDTAGAFVTSHRKEGGLRSWDWTGRITRDGRVLAAAMRMQREGNAIRGSEPVLVRFDSLGQPADTFAIPRHDAPVFKHEQRRGGSVSRISVGVPFTPSLGWTMDADGFFWTGVSDRYRLARLSLRGDTVRVVERAWTAAPVTGDDRRAALERLTWFRDQGGELDESRIPSTKPAFRRIATDDRGFLWVEPELAEADDRRVMDVFDADGRYLGPVRFPEALPPGNPVLIRGDRVYAVVLDEMEVPYVVRYRIRGRRA